MAPPPVLPEDVFRAANPANNPSSDVYDPPKGDIIALLRWMLDAVTACSAATGVDPTIVSTLRTSLTNEIARAQREEGARSRAQLRALLGTVAALDLPPRGPTPVSWVDDSAHARSIAIPDPANTLPLYPIMGQSNAFGATTGAVVSTSNPYPGRVLMPEGGLHTYGGVANLADMQEGIDLVAHETIASGFATHLVRDLDAAIPNTNFRVASFISALGSRSYPQLTEGSDQFTFGMRAISQIYQQQRRKGCRVLVPGVLWVQGENDNTGGWGDHYDGMLDQLQQRLETRIQQITGQIEPVILYLAQTNSINTWDSILGQRVQEAQIRAAARNPLLCLVGPMYSFAVNPADHVHKTSRGAYEMGQMFGRAVFMRQYGSARAVALTPLDVWRATPPAGVAARISATFRVPVEPLVLDASGNVIAVSGMAAVPSGTGGGYGFDVYDDLGNVVPISAVSVGVPSTQYAGPPRLDIDLAVAPTARRLRVNYAQRRDDARPDTSDGPLTGARGCLRDSAAHTSIVGGGPQYNWCVQFSRLIAA
ncbi:hypothetical protein M446_0204 [Methylobacterium sp. 4-46]|uniref:sialate O-acetylesterase n=1 Tax=unclassified Methylobacterium TaxID=2615210 RepID=UPI000165C926|nr:MULTISPECIES: sialate O-acetylesterase [Methylobacterium]ACA14778.1 hypothetical protein M446_0204 [Methylobacterium sp. 4-46]WFT80528.1 sialate O-acetylesterase [Methylobacterium nodulans]